MVFVATSESCTRNLPRRIVVQCLRLIVVVNKHSLRHGFISLSFDKMKLKLIVELDFFLLLKGHRILLILNERKIAQDVPHYYKYSPIIPYKIKTKILIQNMLRMQCLPKSYKSQANYLHPIASSNHLTQKYC